jgi:hypothetical protein
MSLNLASTSILNSLIDATKSRLEQYLKTDITDDAKANLVRAGELQQNPLPTGINILVHFGGEAWPDVLNTDGRSAGKWADFAYEIGGGGIMWRRRFLIELSLYFPNEKDRDVARMKTHVVISRAINALLTWKPGETVPQDSFGESVYDIQVCESCISEGGGVGTFIWRGDLKVEFLTTITPIGA